MPHVLEDRRKEIEECIAQASDLIDQIKRLSAMMGGDADLIVEPGTVLLLELAKKNFEEALEAINDYQEDPAPEVAPDGKPH